VRPGRYAITPGQGQSGNFVVNSADGDLNINEIPGVDYGVPSVTTTLADGDSIQIMNMSGVTFTPAETELSTTLSAGDWVVGLDIPAGRYSAAPDKAGESGNFVIFGGLFGLPTTNEILGGDYGVPSATVNLSDGQVIFIGGLSSVTFTAA
jgi:hypothetical protein